MDSKEKADPTISEVLRGTKMPVVYVHIDPSGPSEVAVVDSEWLDKVYDAAVKGGYIDPLLNNSDDAEFIPHDHWESGIFDEVEEGPEQEGIHPIDTQMAMIGQFNKQIEQAGIDGFVVDRSRYRKLKADSEELSRLKDTD